MNVKAAVFILCAATLLVSCNKDADVEAPDSKAGTESSAAPRTKRLPRIAPPERIKEIRESGRSGLWSTPDTLCAGGKRKSVVLTWNVEKSNEVEKTALFVVDDKSGAEKAFGRGGAVGERKSGPWARAGTRFVLRNSATKQKVAEYQIGAGCPSNS